MRGGGVVWYVLLAILAILAILWFIKQGVLS